MKVPGFRQGHVPAEVVKKEIKQEYLTIGIYEELINNGVKELLKDNKDIKFIGQPYDLKPEDKDKKKIITFKLDVYPKVEIVNENRKKAKMKKLETKVSKKEVDDAMTNLKKNYAEYKDTATIQEDTVSKINIEYLDKDDKIKETSNTYIGEPEFNEFPFFKTTFIGKKKEEKIELDYKEKDLPPTLKHTKKENKDIKQIRFIIKDIKQIVLPEMDETTLKKLFGPDTKVKNEKDLIEYIETNIKAQKKDQELIQTIEEYLKEIRNKSLKVSIPNTLTEEEFKTRIKNLEQKFGTQEKVEEYFKQLGEEKSKAFLADIKRAAVESLEKFFILQKIVELLKLNVNREKNQQRLEVEQKLYEKLTGDKLYTENTETKEEKKKTTKK